MSLHPLAQLGQLTLALGLGAALGLAFDMLRAAMRAGPVPARCSTSCSA